MGNATYLQVKMHNISYLARFLNESCYEHEGIWSLGWIHDEKIRKDCVVELYSVTLKDGTCYVFVSKNA